MQRVITNNRKSHLQQVLNIPNYAIKILHGHLTLANMRSLATALERSSESRAVVNRLRKERALRVIEKKLRSEVRLVMHVRAFVKNYLINRGYHHGYENIGVRVMTIKGEQWCTFSLDRVNMTLRFAILDVSEREPKRYNIQLTAPLIFKPGTETTGKIGNLQKRVFWKIIDHRFTKKELDRHFNKFPTSYSSTNQNTLRRMEGTRTWPRIEMSAGPHRYGTWAWAYDLQ